jgi:two-component system probable response regulator PhcQ
MNEVNTSPAILFVDDEPTAVKYFERVIGAIAPVVVAGSVTEARELLETHGATLKVIVSDQRMPGEYGNVLLSHAAEQFPHMVRILTTAYSELDDTVEAINLGQIHRYIRKPWDVRGLRLEILQALELATLLGERNELLREKIGINRRQVLLSRIGAVRSIGMTAGMTESFDAMDQYLIAGMAVGVQRVEPDWSVLDFTDLIAMEAERSGRFGLAVSMALHGLRGVHYEGGEAALLQLKSLLGDALALESRDSAAIRDARLLTEFLDGAPDSPVRKEASDWLAFLLWVTAHGVALHMTTTDGAVQCQVVAGGEVASGRDLTAWTEMF